MKIIPQLAKIWAKVKRHIFGPTCSSESSITTSLTGVIDQKNFMYKLTWRSVDYAPDSAEQRRPSLVVEHNDDACVWQLINVVRFLRTTTTQQKNSLQYDINFNVDNGWYTLFYDDNKQVANILCAKASSASYPLWDEKWVVAYGLWGEVLVWLIGAVLSASYKPRVQLFVKAGNGWLHSALRYH